MLDTVLKAWDKNNHLIKEWLRETRQEEYTEYRSLLKKTIEIIFQGEDYFPDYERITEIDNGDYQGTYLYVIGGTGYQPSAEEHYLTYVWYGSCSGCDTLQGISEYDYELPSEEQVEGYWTLCLHMMQRMKKAFTEVDYN